MKWFRRVLYFLGAVLALLLVLAGVLFIPAVQRALVLSVLEANAEEVSLEKVSAGFGGAELSGLAMTLPDGSRVSVDAISASGSMLSLSGRRIELEAVRVDGLLVDLTETRTRARARPAEAEPISPEEILKTVEGILTEEGALPVRVSLDELAVNARLIADASTEATLEVSGRDIKPGERSTVTLRALVTHRPRAGEKATTVNADGLIELWQAGRADGPTVAAALEVRGDWPGLGGQAPAFRARGALSGTSKSERYEAHLGLPDGNGGYEDVVSVHATLDAERARVSGDFEARAGEALRRQLTPFVAVPRFEGAARGKFAFSVGDPLTFSASGSADGRITRMSALSEALEEALESLDFTGNFEVGLAGSVVRIKAVDATVVSGDGQTLALVALPQVLELDLEAIETAGERLSGELLVVEINDMPAASLNPLLPPLPVFDAETGALAVDEATGEPVGLELGFSQGTLGGRLVLESPDGESTFSLVAREPLSARGVVLYLPQDDFAVTEPLTIEAHLNGGFDGRAITVGLEPLTVSSKGETFFRQEASVQVDGLLDEAVVVRSKGTQSLQLTALMRQAIFNQPPFLESWQALAGRKPRLEAEWDITVAPGENVEVYALRGAMLASDGTALFELVAPGGLAFSLEDTDYTLSDLRSASDSLANLSVTDFPLAALNQPAIGLHTDGTVRALNLTLAREPGRLRVSSRQPVDLRGVSFGFGGRDYAKNLGLSGSLSASSDLGNRLDFNLEGMRLRDGRITFAQGDLGGSVDLGRMQPLALLTVDMAINDLPLMFDQPPLQPYDNLRRGSGTIRGRIAPAEDGTFSLDIGLSNLMAREDFASSFNGLESITSLTLAATGEAREAGEHLRFTLPLTMRTSTGSTTEASARVDWRLGSRLEVDVSAKTLAVADLNLLLKPFQPDEDIAPPQRMRSLMGMNETPEPAHAQPTPAPDPTVSQWQAVLGDYAPVVDLTLDVDTFEWADFVMEGIRGDVTVTPDAVVGQLSGDTDEGEEAVVESRVRFEAGEPEPYEASLEVRLDGVEPPERYLTRLGEQTREPLLTGLIRADGKLTSRAKDLEALADNFEGDFVFESTGGVIRGLGGWSRRFTRLTTLLEGPAALGSEVLPPGLLESLLPEDAGEGGLLNRASDKVKELRPVIRVVEYLNAIEYDQVRLVMHRGPDGANIEVREFVVANETLRVRGEGVIEGDGAELFVNPRIDLSLNLAGRDFIAETLRSLRLDGDQTAEGMVSMKRPFNLSGPLGRGIESNLVELLVAAGLDRALEEVEVTPGGGARSGTNPEREAARAAAGALFEILRGAR